MCILIESEVQLQTTGEKAFALCCCAFVTESHLIDFINSMCAITAPAISAGPTVPFQQFNYCGEQRCEIENTLRVTLVVFKIFPLSFCLPINREGISVVDKAQAHAADFHFSLTLSSSPCFVTVFCSYCLALSF